MKVIIGRSQGHLVTEHGVVKHHHEIIRTIITEKLMPHSGLERSATLIQVKKKKKRGRMVFPKGRE